MSEEPEAKSSFKVRNFVESPQLAKDLTYSLADLSTAMMDQAQLFVHYGIQAAKASKQVDDLKMLLEIAESKVYRSLRDKAVEDGVKVTEAQLEKNVSVHSKVVEFKRALNEAKQIEAVAKIATEGFRHRKDMLVQHGATSREEMKGEVSISRRNALEDSVDASKTRILENIRNKRGAVDES